MTIATTRHGYRFWGMMANAVLSLSLEPPLMLISGDRRNQMGERIVKANALP